MTSPALTHHTNTGKTVHYEQANSWKLYLQVFKYTGNQKRVFSVLSACTEAVPINHSHYWPVSLISM